MNKQVLNGFNAPKDDLKSRQTINTIEERNDETQMNIVEEDDKESENININHGINNNEYKRETYKDEFLDEANDDSKIEITFIATNKDIE